MVVQSNRPSRPLITEVAMMAGGQRTTYPLPVEGAREVPMTREKQKIVAPSSRRVQESMVVVVQERQYQGNNEGRRGLGHALAGYLRTHQCGTTRCQSRGSSDFVRDGTDDPDVQSAAAVGRY